MILAVVCYSGTRRLLTAQGNSYNKEIAVKLLCAFRAYGAHLHHLSK